MTQEKDTFYLLVQDECHWGIMRTKGDQSVIGCRYINAKEAVEAENLFYLQVSATPQSFLVMDEFKDQSFVWDSIIENKVHLMI